MTTYEERLIRAKEAKNHKAKLCLTIGGIFLFFGILIQALTPTAPIGALIAFMGLGMFFEGVYHSVSEPPKELPSQCLYCYWRNPFLFQGTPYYAAQTAHQTAHILEQQNKVVVP